MKRILFLAGILFCISSCKIVERIPIIEKATSSRTYNLPDSVTYQVIEITNPIMYQMLDSILKLSEECIFTIHEQPVKYSFYSGNKDNTVFFFLYARQYEGGIVYNDNYVSYCGPLEKYCFVYKGIWFTGNVFPYDSESDYFNNFFKLTEQEKKLNIYFPDTKIYYWDSNCYFCFPDEAYIYCGFQNNTIVEIKSWSCENIDVIYHTVRKYETLHELAEKYRTTEKRIKELNPQLLLEEKLPEKMRIRVQ